jgi:hypothetical protein
MAGYIVDNHLKGAAEETTVAATVTAAETATATEMVAVTARIRMATPMLKCFLVGSTSSFLELAK